MGDLGRAIHQPSRTSRRRSYSAEIIVLSSGGADFARHCREFTDRVSDQALKMRQTALTDQESMAEGAGGYMTRMFSGSTMAAGPPANRVFVIEINGNAILAFEATTMREAMELGRETWLRSELQQLTLNDAPVWDSKAPIRARTASPEEAEIFRRADKDDSADDLPMVYLIELDRASSSDGPVARGAFPPRR